MRVIYIYENIDRYILGRKTQQFFSVKQMAESLVENEPFNAGNGWMKVPYKMETDSLGGSHPEDCQGKQPAPTSPTPLCPQPWYLDQEMESVPQPQMV